MNKKFIVSIILITTLVLNGCFSLGGNIRTYEEMPPQDSSKQETATQREKKLVDCNAFPPVADLSFAGLLLGIGVYSAASSPSSDNYDGGGGDIYVGNIYDGVGRLIGIMVGVIGIIPLFSGLVGLSKYSTCKDELSAACKTANTTITPLVFPPPARSETKNPGIGLGLTYRF